MKLAELSRGIADGRWSCRKLTACCLEAIAENDQSGRKLNTVAEIDPDVWFRAEAIDREIREQGLKSPLHGIPVLLKDNIDAAGLHTTAGSLALSDNLAAEDSAVAARLRSAGALLLGKANLSEFAYFMSRDHMPSGYSSLAGQVVHAYVPGFDPLGSSSGSAVAVSARFVPYSIGTETDGSLISPAGASAIVTIKPTVGLVSRRGILPLSPMQDTAGPMGTCVEDVAAVLEVIAGYDEGDPATWNCRTAAYTQELCAGVGQLRIAIFRNSVDECGAAALDRAAAILTEAGAAVTEITPEMLYLDESTALLHEFKASLNRYLAGHGSACRSLKDIIDFNRAHAEQCLVHGQTLLEEAEALSGRLVESEYLKARASLRAKARAVLDGAFRRADVLLSAGPGPRGNLAPVAGYPCMGLPAAEPDETALRPLSYYLIGPAYGESLLLRTAAVLEEALALICRPSWVKPGLF